VAAALQQLREQYDLGADPEVVLRDLLELTHLLTRLQVAPEAAADPSLSEVERQRAERLAQGLSMPVLARTWQMLLKGLGEVRGAPSALAAAEMILIRLAYSTNLPTPIDAVRQAAGATDSGAAPAPAPVAGSSPTSSPGSALGRQMGQTAAVSAQAVPEAMPVQVPEHGADEIAEQASMPPATRQVSGDLAEPVSQIARIDSFAAIADHAKAVRDARLYHHLMEDIRLVAFRPGHLEIRPEDNAPADLANKLRRKLEAWTGETWAVVINSQAAGQPPLAAQQRQTAADILTDTESDPLVKAVLDTFPGAKVTDVRPLGDGRDDGDAAAPEQVDASNGVEQR
jgi:DNA polymerase-3 subunit gamma/tau